MGWRGGKRIWISREDRENNLENELERGNKRWTCETDTWTADKQQAFSSPTPYPSQTLPSNFSAFPTEPECGPKSSPVTHHFQSPSVAYKGQSSESAGYKCKGSLCWPRKAEGESPILENKYNWTFIFSCKQLSQESLIQQYAKYSTPISPAQYRDSVPRLKQGSVLPVLSLAS